jgi:hypothetical protein
MNLNKLCEELDKLSENRSENEMITEGINEVKKKLDELIFTYINTNFCDQVKEQVCAIKIKSDLIRIKSQINDIIINMETL